MALQLKRSGAVYILFVFDDGTPAVRTALRSLVELPDDETVRPIVWFTLPDADLATRFVPGRTGYLIVAEDGDRDIVRKFGRMEVTEVRFGHMALEIRPTDGRLERSPTFKITLVPVEE